MNKVIKLDIITKLDIDAESMLQEIAKEKPDNVFVIAWNDDDVSYHSSTGDTAAILMELQRFIHQYFNREFK